jgi:hypothetical protein
VFGSKRLLQLYFLGVLGGAIMANWNSWILPYYHNNKKLINLSNHLKYIYKIMKYFLIFIFGFFSLFQPSKGYPNNLSNAF